ncbi:ATP-dependent RNA helicase DeaD [compost metagenome]
MDEFAELSKEEVIKKFASLEFNRFLEYYKNAPDLNASEERSDRGERGDRGSRSFGNSGYTRLFINVGSVDDFTRGDLLGFVCNNGKISGKTVGKIDLKGVYSFIEVESDTVDTLINNFRDVRYSGREVRIEISGEAPMSRSQDGDRKRGFGGAKREGAYGSNDRRSSGGSDRRGGSGRRESGFRDYSGRSREERGGRNGGNERRRRS